MSKKTLLLVLTISISLLLPACGKKDKQPVNPFQVQAQAGRSQVLAEEIAAEKIGKFECQTNQDCPTDQWCYVTKETAYCKDRS